MAAYEVLLLNTAIPQIQAAQAGDTYVCPRDIQITANLDVTGNTILGDASTDTVRVNGYMGVGGAASASRAIYVQSTALTGTTQSGIFSSVTGSSAATSNIEAFRGTPASAAAAFTVANMSGLRITDGTKGAGSTITSLRGVLIDDQTQGTNNYGIESQVSSGANKWNIYASGTAANYFAGNVLVGTTASLGTAGVQAAAVSTDPFEGYRFGANANGPTVSLYKNRGATVGTNAVVVSGDELGTIAFRGYDGAAYRAGAFISGNVDGTPGASDMPGRLTFSTTADGAATPTERMRIDSSGNVGIGTNAPVTFGKLAVVGSVDVNNTVAFRTNDPTVNNTSFNSIVDITGTAKDSGGVVRYNNTTIEALGSTSNGGTLVFRTDDSSAVLQERMRIDLSGNVGIGTPTPAYALDVTQASGSPSIRVLRTSSAGADLRLVSSVLATGGIVGTYSASPLLFYADSAERARITAAGDFGIGTTSPGAKLHVEGAEIRIKNGTDVPNITLAGRSSDGTAILAFQNNASSANNATLTATTNTLAIATGGTERARITSGGYVGIGNTSPPTRLTIGSLTDSEGINILRAYRGGFVDQYAEFSSANGHATINSQNGAGGTINFRGDGTERARITSGGYFKASNDGTYVSSTGSYHEFRQTATNLDVLQFSNTAASPYGVIVNFTAASPDNNTNTFLLCKDSTANRCIIYSDGDLANHDGVYGTISDQKLKQDIVDAGSQWDDLKAIRFRKYRMKSDVAANPDAPYLLGVVAQELEQVSPGLVDAHPDMETVEVTDEDGNITQTQQPTGTTTKSVKSSILLMKAAVALQEAMARIEQLEAKVASLGA